MVYRDKIVEIEQVYARYPVYIKMLLLEVNDKVKSQLRSENLKESQKQKLTLKELSKLVFASKLCKKI